MSDFKKLKEIEANASLNKEPCVIHSLLDGDIVAAKLEYDTKNKSSCKCNAKAFMICKTVAMVAVWVCMGLRMFVEFTTIPNLRLRLQTDVEGLSYAMSFGAMGGLLASPLAALADRYGGHSDIILSLLLIFAAIFNGIKPYCSTLTVFAVCDLLQDMAWGVIAPIGDSVITSMWGAQSGPPLHSVHTGFTIGAVIAPFLVSAFVPEETDFVTGMFVKNANISHYHRNTTVVSGVNDETAIDNSSIEYAYVICSILMVAIALIFLIFEFIRVNDTEQTTKKKSYKWKAILNPYVWAEGSAIKGILVFLAMNLFYICHLGALKGPTMLLTTYAVDSDLNFTNTEAVALTSGASIGGLLARGILIVVSGYVSVNTILIVTIHGQLIASMCLLFFGTKSKQMLWVFSSIFGAVVRPIWAAGYQWANDYIILVAFHFAMTRMLTKTVDIGQNALQGYLYTNVTKESTFYTSVVYAAINCIVLYAMLLIGRHFGTRHQKSKIETKV